MSGIPRLAEVLAEHQPDECGSCAACSWHPGNDGCFDIDFARHQADAWFRACQVTTVAQLDALPTNPMGCEGIVIKDSTGAICELDDDGTWTRDGEKDTPSSRIKLPALLIWAPDWKTP